MAYLLAWPGMKPAEFFAKPSQGTLAAPAIHERIFALGKFSIGLALLFIVAPASHGSHPLLIGWIGMLGAIMLLHFGLFHILSCVWRLCGLGARPIMNWPILACSLSEFWGQRWNLAFRDLTHQFVFRPTAKRWGATAALLISFVLSGLIHDLAISIPAGGGYGWPTAYFCLQAMGILIEKSALGKACRLSQGWCGRFYTAALLLLPITWLFHHHFVETVFVPFLEAIGATS
jgi:hypothetical protein